LKSNGIGGSRNSLKPMQFTEINRCSDSKGGKEAEQADYISNSIARLSKKQKASTPSTNY